jgi:small-conductance mechanosensitive channel
MNSTAFAPINDLRDTLTIGMDWLASHTTQIMLGIAAGLVIIAVFWGLRSFGTYVCRTHLEASHWPRIIGQALGKTRLWFMIAIAVRIIAAIAHAPAEIAYPIHIGFVVATVLQAAIWARTLILGLVDYRAGETDSTGNLQSAIGLIRVLVTAGLFLLAAILILSNLGVNVTALIAGLGVGGIAIGLAAQGIFSDLFAALSVLFDKPFLKGDMVRFDQTQGTVESIGLKSTRIRAISGEEIVISNANLLNKELRNLTQQHTRRYFQVLALVYQTPPDVCRALPDMLKDIVESVDGCQFGRCGLDNFSPSSLDFLLIYEIEGEDAGEALDRKHQINTRILEVFGQKGIAFAYPTQTTFTAAPDGRMVMPYFDPSLGAGGTT